jgi:hypothetical protein
MIQRYGVDLIKRKRGLLEIIEGGKQVDAIGGGEWRRGMGKGQRAKGKG